MTWPQDQKSEDRFWSLLRCPECREGGLRSTPLGGICGVCGALFPMRGGRPVLIRKDNELFPQRVYLTEPEPAPRRSCCRLLPSPSVNLSRRRCLKELAAELRNRHLPTVLVVGGGEQRAQLDQAFSDVPGIQTICGDVDTGAVVECFFDAHELPFQSGVIDAVVTTAVLEHVMDPWRVAEEISRVLKPGGQLYAETPFMQQVHEGAYDFTRWSLSGHRRLWDRFQEIDSGLVAGPATALLWSLEHFTLTFCSRRFRNVAKALVRMSLFWIKYADFYLCRRPTAVDGASCTYFRGRKWTHKRAEQDIIAAYRGGQEVHHL